jgi:tryptophan synthase beta chain
MGAFYSYIQDSTVQLIALKLPAKVSPPAITQATLCAGRPGVLHGNRTYLLQDPDGQIIETIPSQRASTTRAWDPSMHG